jgi:hypothetical protein
MRSFSPPERLIGWLLPVLAIVAEGALLAVVYVAVQVVIDGRAPLLGTFELAAGAGVTAFAVRRRWLDADERPMSFLFLLAGLGTIGWLWSAEARELLLAGDLVTAISVHPGGWLLLVAGMRGVGRAFEVDDRAVTRLVLGGVPALAIPWAFGQLTAPAELRPVFTDAAFVASLTFVTAGFIAAGLARLQEIGRETGIDWRHDRSWMGTVFGVLVVVLALGIPASMLLGLPAHAVARGILDPVLAVAGYVFVALAAAAALAAALLAVMLRSIGVRLPSPMTAEEIARLQEVPGYTFEQLRGGLTGLAVTWIALIVVLIVLLRVWQRRRKRHVMRTPDEERSIQLPSWRRRRGPVAVRTVTGRPGRERAVDDAVSAYLASLDELARGDAARGRAEHETPRSHARRIGRHGGAELAALQADYALVRYGERPLTRAEHRRAIGRWERLRLRLRS